MRIDRPPTPAHREPAMEKESPLYQAAQGMEAQFMKEMLRNMRKTVQESPEMAGNRGFQIFRGMLDDHYAEQAVKTQGIGLAELIVNQVLDQQRNADRAAAMAAGPAPEPTAAADESLNKNDTVKEETQPGPG